jgi:2-C-methyl-D-erythritol 4-phosphate cytidylyltransferase/2-C-methyl-D-erythritol 2,4-cyclodiphosphate synthase
MTLERFAGHPDVGLVQPVIHPDDDERYVREAAGLALLPAAFGGATRQESVLAGLDALAPKTPDIVLVHDAARPFASAALIARSIAAAPSITSTCM